MSLNVAVVGAGMAGLSCASRLIELGHRVQVFEKSRGPSGRMSTRRTEFWECDHGAQYFTATDPAFQKAVAEWIAQGVAAPWTPRLMVFGDRAGSQERADPGAITRFVGTPRMTSPGQFLAARLDIQTNIRIAGIAPSGSRWGLIDVEKTVIAEGFDAVILAVPAPQIPPIVVQHPPVWMHEVQTIEMLPCWALMAEVDQAGTAAFDAAFVNEGPLSWIANNSTKPGRGKAPMWTIHASPRWTQEHLLAQPEDVIPMLVQAFQSCTGLTVVDATAHRWLYSLPKTKSDIGCLWDPALGLGACGDWLLGGKVQGAWLSGRACADRITA